MILLRVVGGLLGLGLAVWAFDRFRFHLIRRFGFSLVFLIGTALLIVSIYPNSINTFAAMLALEGRMYGRLIAILIPSNILLWLWLLHMHASLSKRDRQFDLLVRKVAASSLQLAEAGVIRPVMVIIPALNEADNLKELLPRMPPEVSGLALGVLVVDDGSTDGTAELAAGLGCGTVRNPLNRGGGAALRLGFDVAMDGGAEIIVTMDADGQHLPEEIESLVRPIVDGQYDFVVGSRLLGRHEKDSRVRIVGVHVFNRVINFLSGTDVSDCSSGFRAFNMDAAKKLYLVQDQFHTAEAIMEASRKGLRIGDVPITILKRKHGKSKKGANLSYGMRFAQTILRTWWQ